MLLGLLSFSVSAQNDNGCKSGFWIENLQPDTVYGVVNMPPDGKLPLSHTLGHFLNGSTVLPGNATYGATELYELHFCNTCGLDPKTKVSLDWVLLRKNDAGEWVEVNDDLSNWAEFSIYTFYNQLNQYGQCQSIMWEGGRVPDEHGYCEDQGITTGIPLLDTISGLNCPQYSPTNYPGAMHVAQGYPMAVPTELGNILPAAGLVGLYSQNHDYFYLDFFDQTRNIVVIKWKYVGDYKLVMRVRQRLGGTPWTNEYWKWENGTLSQTDYVGGHQSCCGPVLVEDTIYRPDFGEACKEVCEGESYVYGRPPYTFDVTMPDTNVVFGDVVGEGTDCAYFDVDSVNRFHFFVRVTPQVQAQDLTVCKCTEIDLNSLVTLADTANQGVVSVRLEWSLNGSTGWTTTVPTAPEAVGTYTYYVRQTNIYNTCGEPLECTGPAVPITVTINELPAPTGGSYDICNESEETTMTLTVSRDNDVNHCSTTSVWKLNGDSVYTGDSYAVTLADLRPETNIDQVITYHVYAYNAATNCYSADYSIVTLTFHQTPEIQLSYLDTICPHPANVVFNMLVTSTQTEFPYSVHQTSTFDADYDDTLTSPNNQLVSTYHKPYTQIEDFECEGVYYLYYEVTDANGCVVKDTAKFIALDTIPPTVSPDTLTTVVNVCNFEGANRPDTIKTLAGFDGLLDELYDECGEIARHTYKDSTYRSEVDTCEYVLVRTYTFYDNCENASTFTHIFIAHDSIAPEFVSTGNRPLYQRLAPKRGMNCTFNSLSKAEFVMAFLGKVGDNCKGIYDSAYLYDHADFYWENSIRFNHSLAYDSVDIFREFTESVWVDGNKQLTIEVVVWDDCGNTSDTLAFWFEPDSLVLEPAITIDPDRICLGDTSYLYFDSTKVSYTHYELAHPLSFAWASRPADINFDDATNVRTFVVPGTGDTTYHINMTVSDAYGCTVSSDSVELYVKSAPNMKIIPVTEFGLQPPYCPTIGTVHLVAVNAVDSTFVPNLTYVWTSTQSLDVSARGDTTRLYVIPDSCTYTYDAQVFVTDTIYGCTAEASILVPVEDQAPSYIGPEHIDTAFVGPGCVMRVTDFTHYVTPNTIENVCGWAFSRYTIWQEPAEGTIITMDSTPVHVFIKTPCGEDVVEIMDKFANIADTNTIDVVASVEPAEGCSPVAFNFTATVDKNVGVPTYKWTKGTSTTAISTAQSFTRTEVTEEGEMESHYTYTVKVVDPVTNCTATSSVQVAVYDSLPIPDYEVFPNDRCQPVYNGLIRLLGVPRYYTYELFNGEDQVDIITTQIPELDPQVDTTSIIFDELEGNIEYMVKITTIHGCVTRFDVFVPDSAKNPVFNDEVIPHAPFNCTNNDGWIEVIKEAGFTYHLFKVSDPNVEIPEPYTNLTPGDYYIYKYDVNTDCDTFKIVTITPSTNGLTFNVGVTHNSLCGGVNFNGSLTFSQTGIHYVITNTAGETLYDGPNGVLEGLQAGVYTVYGIDNTTGCAHYEYPEVLNNTTNPQFTVTPHANQFCENEAGAVNGYVTISAATGANYTYEYYELPDSTIVEVVDSLAAGDYYVIATDANGCTTKKNFTITDNQRLVNATATATANSICDSSIALYNGTAKITISNYIASYNYTVTLEEMATSEVSTKTNATKNTTFSNLNSGTYKYIVTDKYMCVDSGFVTVPQADLPPLQLVQTPNTMCEGTYDHPGNGTITVLPPYDDAASGNFAYAYFYAPVGERVQGDSLHVDYHNLSKTMYHLVDTCYFVTVLDHRTGCMVYDTITVELGSDTLIITGDPTPNKNCIAPFTGSIQWHVTYKRYDFDYELYPYLHIPDPGYLFSIDGGLTYQTDSLFTGLEDGPYTVVVKDTATGCVTSLEIPVIVEKTPSDIYFDTIVTANQACDPELYNGAITATAHSVMFGDTTFVYSFNGGEFGKVNTWESLAPGIYRIVALDTVSGCSDTIDVEINTENECTPIIDVDVRKYCLGEQNAEITAVAYYPEGSDCEGDFTYDWYKECHAEHFPGPTAPVATDEEMCCYYTVTVTNTLTGCTNIRTVKVCVVAPHAIQYTVNHDPIDGKSTTVCENESLYIGVVQNGWAQAWWTMNHVTDTTVTKKEYEFFVSTPDSIAAHVGDERWNYYPEPVTFCLDVVDTNGCPMKDQFNLYINPLVRITNQETVCQLPLITNPDQQLPVIPTNGDDIYVIGTPALEGYDVDEELLAAIQNGTVEYPYSVSHTETIPAIGEGCDTVLTTVLTVLGYPTITGVLEDAYCEGSATVGDLMDSITITNYVEETLQVLLNGTDVTSKMDSVLTYDPDYPCMTLTVSCSSSAEMQCYKSKDFIFRLNAVPELSDIDEIDTVCASEDGVIQIPFDYTCRYDNASCNLEEPNEANDNQDVEESQPCTVEVILKESADATEYTVLEYTLFDGDWYEITPVKLSYNNKYIGFKVTNNCGSVFSNFVQLHVDTVPVGEIDTNAICAGLQFADLTTVTITNTADLLDPSNVTITTFVKKVGYDQFTQVDPEETVDYSYDGAEMYAVLDGNNGCGTFTTETLPVKVSDKPHINMNAQDLRVCADGFDEAFAETFGYYIPSPTPTENPTIPDQQFEPFKYNPGDLVPEDLSTIAAYNYVLSNGSPFIHTYWATATLNEEGEIVSLDSVSVDDIRTLAVDTCIDIYYFAQNACGTDTVGPFPVCIVDAPEITYTTGVICRTSTVSEVLNIVKVNWHKNPGYTHYTIRSASGDVVMYVDGSETMENIISYGYNGYNLVFSAVNSCDSVGVEVVLNIPWWEVEQGEMKAACAGSAFSAFIEEEPSLDLHYTTVTSQGWYVYNATATAAVADEEITSTTVVDNPIEVYYKWVTACGDIITSDTVMLDLLYNPEVTINNITICEGSTVDIANANLYISDLSIVNGDPTWTINGEPYSATATYGYEYNNTDIVVTVPTACDPVTATAKLIVNPAPVVEIEGPEKVCDGTEVTFVATPNFTSYTFTLNGGDPIVQNSNEFTTVLTVSEDAQLGTSISTVSVTVTDQYNCSSSSAGTASVIVSNSVGFIFTNMNHEVTNEFEASTGAGMQYIWMVNDECLRNDTLVWVEYEFYRNGVALTNRSPYDNHTELTPAHIETYIRTMTVSNGSSSFPWNTINEMDFEVQNTDGSTGYMHDLSYYFGASGYADVDFPSVDNYYGNHFPYSNLSFLTTTNYYDDLWMHFLARRPITQTISEFLIGGEYTIVFKLYATSYRDNWQNPHIDQAEGWSIAENTISPRAIDPHGGILIGGHWYARGIPTLLAVDSIHISVDGPDIDPETTPEAPELAPAVTVDASEIAPDMEVWPNPAPAITTTLKARVHNMSGEATVTLNTLGGTQVYADKINIDNDNFYFEFGVNNLSVGTYVMTVRTGDAIITKKVVVTSLAQ